MPPMGCEHGQQTFAGTKLSCKLQGGKDSKQEEKNRIKSMPIDCMLSFTMLPQPLACHQPGDKLQQAACRIICSRNRSVCNTSRRTSMQLLPHAIPAAKSCKQGSTWLREDSSPNLHYKMRCKQQQAMSDEHSRSPKFLSHGT